MKNQVAKPLAHALDRELPALRRAPNWRLRYIPPTADILRAIFIEDSRDPSAFYLYAFAMPFYVPAECIVFDLGERIRTPTGSDLWTIGDADSAARAASIVGMRFLDRFATVELIADGDDLGPSHYALQARAYSLVRCGRFAEAHKRLRELVDVIGDRYSWQQDIAKQAADFDRLLDRDSGAALARLDQWAAATAAAIGVPRDG